LTHFEAPSAYAFASAFLELAVVLRRLAVDLVTAAYGCCWMENLLGIESEVPGNSIKAVWVSSVARCYEFGNVNEGYRW
jgi:hypothetical protein